MFPEANSNRFEQRPPSMLDKCSRSLVDPARRPPVWLKHGDELECTVEGIGTLRNSVVHL